jgi:hypothetical protein
VNVPEWYARKLIEEQPGDTLASANPHPTLARIHDMPVAVPYSPRRQLLLYVIVPVFLVTFGVLAAIVLSLS